MAGSCKPCCTLLPWRCRVLGVATASSFNNTLKQSIANWRASGLSFKRSADAARISCSATLVAANEQFACRMSRRPRVFTARMLGSPATRA